jgi:hypothetical protein
MGGEFTLLLACETLAFALAVVTQIFKAKLSSRAVPGIHPGFNTFHVIIATNQFSNLRLSCTVAQFVATLSFSQLLLK